MRPVDLVAIPCADKTTAGARSFGWVGHSPNIPKEERDTLIVDRAWLGAHFHSRMKPVTKATKLGEPKGKWQLYIDVTSFKIAPEGSVVSMRQSSWNTIIDQILTGGTKT